MSSDYAAFYEYLETIVTPSDLISYKKNIKELEGDPEAMKSYLEETLIAAWDKNSDPNPRTGNAKTQKANFEKFINKKIIQEDNKGYINYLENKDNPIISRLQEPVFEEEIKHDPNIRVSKKVIGQIKNLAPPNDKKELLKELNVNINKHPEYESMKIDELKKLWVANNQLNTERVRKDRYKRLNASLDRAYQSGNYANVLAIYDEVSKLREDPSDYRSLNSFQINSLLDKAKPFLDRYGVDEKPDVLKSKNELLTALKMKGMELSPNIKYSEVRKIAEEKGIGSYKGELNKDELINKILNKHFYKYDYEELSSKSERELSKIWNKWKFKKPPSKDLFYELTDLPSDKRFIKELYERKGEKIPYNKLPSIKNEIREELPFLDNKELDNRAYKKLAGQALNHPVLEEEIKRRYADWKYNDPNKKLDFYDLIELSKTNKNLFQGTMQKDLERGTIDYSLWKNYKKKLNDEVKTELQMIEVKKKVGKITIANNRPTINNKYKI